MKINHNVKKDLPYVCFVLGHDEVHLKLEHLSSCFLTKTPLCAITTTAQSWPVLNLYLKIVEQTHGQFDWTICQSLSFLLTSWRLLSNVRQKIL